MPLSTTVVAITLAVIQAIAVGLLLIRLRRRERSAGRDAAMLRAVPDLMFVQSRDGVYLDFHANDQSQLVVPPEAFLGRHMRDVLPQPMLDICLRLFDRVWTSDGPVVGEYSLEIGGTEHFYEARLVRYKGDQVLSLIREVTDRAKIAAALRTSEERYARATAAARAGVWEWNLETDTVYVDPRLKALLGFDEHEIGNRIDDLMRRIHPDDRPLVITRAQAHVSGEAPTFEIEHRMLHKDGSVRWFLGRGSVVRQDGSAMRVIGTETDITDQKQAEEALHGLQLDLKRMSRLAALREFGAAIAHEVSQPLAAIVINAGTCLRLLSGASPDIGQIRAMLRDVVEAGKTADAIIRRERESFRQHIVEMRAVEINSVIREVTILAAARLRAEQVRLETRLAANLPTVLGDRIALSEALLNLVSNSLDAMSAVDPTVRVLTITSSITRDSTVQVSVCDQGVGLGDVDTARMYMPAYTTKPRGTGVGLSVSRTIIEAHGGSLWATANTGRGATFSFAVPVKTASSVPA